MNLLSSGVLCATLLLATPPAARAADSANVLARVGEAEIKVGDIQPYLASLTPAQEAALAKDPAALNQFLRTLIVERLLLKQALAAKWDQQPTLVAQLARLRDSTIAQTYLADVAKTPADYPGDAEIQAAYDANQAALVVPRQFRLAQIFIAAPKGDEKEPAKLALVEKALKPPGADFAKLAATNSDETASAANGGEIGWLTEAQIQPETRKAATALAKGAISAPIRLDDGWHILKMLDLKPSYTAPLPEVRDQLAQRLREEKAKQISQEYVGKLLEENPVAINEIAVSQLLKKPAN